MRKASLFIFVFPLITFCFSSCNLDSETVLPGATGRNGELVVVIEKSQWNTTPGQIVKQALGSEQEGLPQSEPIFDLVNIPAGSFSSVFKTHRNILVSNISAGTKEKVEVLYNLWATPQIVVKVSAPDDSTFFSLMERKSERIQNLFLDAEKARILNAYESQRDNNVEGELKTNYSTNITIPRGYSIIKKGDNFVWLQHEKDELIQGLFLFYHDYNDTLSFTKEKIMNEIDSVSQIYVQGSANRSHFSVFRDYPVHISNTTINGKFCSQMRGLWNMKNDFMGGPFVSNTFANNSGDKVVTVVGFVFAPKFNKRNYLRQVETIIGSAEAL